MCHWVSISKGTGITIAYTGGNRMATGSTQTVRKSRTMAACPRAIRGVATTEIAPQPSRTRNFTRSAGLVEVRAAVTPISTSAASGTAPT